MSTAANIIACLHKHALRFTTAPSCTAGRIGERAREELREPA
ncbi:hypothetical protein PF70_00678 [Pseudomonas asplenii]|nr:hypothetical protein PF70_00678 [Pseudomonas fuscovaginae]